MHAMSHRYDFFCLYFKSQYIRTRILLYNHLTFGSVMSRITQLSNTYRDIGLKIFKYLIARGYDLFHK